MDNDARSIMVAQNANELDQMIDDHQEELRMATGTMPALCRSCKWSDKGKCPAFPKGIPESIATYGADHRSVLPSQEGTTVWVLQDGKEEEFEEWMFTFVLPPE